MAQLAKPTRRRFSRAEYYRMAEMGMFDGQRVELVDGVIIRMAAQKDTHVVAVGLVEDALIHAFGPGHWVRVQAPMNLSAYDDPEPDLVVVKGNKRDFIGSQNRIDPLLVVEVSDTTLRFDRGRKALRYARAGVKDYWIVSLVARQLEIYRDPAIRAGKQQFDKPVIFRRGQSAVPLSKPAVSIVVDDLLP